MNHKQGTENKDREIFGLEKETETPVTENEGKDTQKSKGKSPEIIDT